MPLRILSDLVNLFYPHRCILCRNMLVENERHLCLHCLSDLPETGYYLNKDNPGRRLFAGFPQVNDVAAFMFFEQGGKARQLVHALKYHGNKSLAEFLGRIAAIQLKDAGFYAPLDAVVPIPLHPKKEKKRGYNQSELIARGISSVLGCGVDTAGIERIVDTESQTRKSVYDRHLNVDKIFRPTNAVDLRGKHLLLVDDVMTTGATMSAAIETLMEIPGIRISLFSLTIVMEN
jgi:ComF family protein